MKKVLVLGSSNTSAIAHAYLEKFKKCKAEINCAGMEANTINQKIIDVMQAEGIDITYYSNNNFNDYLTIHFDYILIVSDEAKQIALPFNKEALRFDYHFNDAAKIIGSEEDIQQQFIDLRDTIKQYIERFCKMYLNEWQ